MLRDYYKPGSDDRRNGVQELGVTAHIMVHPTNLWIDFFHAKNLHLK